MCVCVCVCVCVCACQHMHNTRRFNVSVFRCDARLTFMHTYALETHCIVMMRVTACLLERVVKRVCDRH